MTGTTRAAILLTIAAWPLALPRDGTAGSLASNLHEFISNVTTPVVADVVEPISPVVLRVGIRGTDFPVTSTTPGFTYSYNPELSAFERTSRSLGPVFLERAETVGRGRIDLGFSYLYANLEDENGDNFGEKVVLGSEINVDGSTLAGVFQGEEFSLKQNVFSFSGTYGITNRWDVNLLVPLLYTVLELEGLAGAALGTGGEPPVVGIAPVRFSDFFDNDAFGVGDLLLRTKYRFYDSSALKAAGGLGIRFPTGDEDDFQGLGDYTVTPALVLSAPLGSNELHGQLGVEANADDLQRSRARYGIGAVVQPVERFAFLVDVIGSSSFVDDEFSIPKQGAVVPDFTLLPNEFVKANRPDEVIAFVPQSNILDVAVGFKVHIAGTAVAFASAIFPLTNDGLRADVVPAGGIEFSF